MSPHMPRITRRCLLACCGAVCAGKRQCDVSPHTAGLAAASEHRGVAHGCGTRASQSGMHFAVHGGCQADGTWPLACSLFSLDHRRRVLRAE